MLNWKSHLKPLTQKLHTVDVWSSIDDVLIWSFYAYNNSLSKFSFFMSFLFSYCLHNHYPTHNHYHLIVNCHPTHIYHTTNNPHSTHTITALTQSQHTHNHSTHTITAHSQSQHTHNHHQQLCNIVMCVVLCVAWLWLGTKRGWHATNLYPLCVLWQLSR